MQKNEQFIENVEDVLDLFPDEGELFFMSENEKIATPNKMISPPLTSSIQRNPSPIEFEETRDRTITSVSTRSDEKSGHNIKLAVTARLGVLLNKLFVI